MVGAANNAKPYSICVIFSDEINFIPVLATIWGGSGGMKGGMFLLEVVSCKAG